jgi:nitroreductase
VPAQERVLSAGAAIQNMLLLATAMGLGSGLTSGKALSSAPLRSLFGLHADEDALCFINIGHVREARKPRPRPPVDAYFSCLDEGAPPPR